MQFTRIKRPHRSHRFTKSTKRILPGARTSPSYLSRWPKGNFTFDSTKQALRFDSLQSVPLGDKPPSSRGAQSNQILPSRLGWAATTWVTAASSSKRRRAAEGAWPRRGGGGRPAGGRGLRAGAPSSLPFCLRPSSRHVTPRPRACAPRLAAVVVSGLRAPERLLSRRRRWRRPGRAERRLGG